MEEGKQVIPTNEEMLEMNLSVLKSDFEEIEKADTDYDRRYTLVMHAVTLALFCDFKAGFRLDPAEPEWPVAYIELPTGQVSWHMPQHELAYDGHTTEEKYQRIHEFLGS